VEVRGGVTPEAVDGLEGRTTGTTARRYEHSDLERILLPPLWSSHRPDEFARLDSVEAATGQRPAHFLGTDRLGRDLFTRLLTGGGISLAIGLAAAAISVIIGTLYGTIAATRGGRTDAVMMRIVDVLYGLPYVLLVVLLAVAMDGFLQNRADSIDPGTRQVINVLTLIVAIGGVSWLTMARVIRGQVLSLKEQPFMEACRAIGVPPVRQFTRHLLPNLMGPIVVYATLTVPQAILQESFLSFLGIGVQAPLPSWGNLAAEGLSELNPVRARWWLLLWPCLLLAVTLLSLNFVGEGLRSALDPRRKK
jgi:ABC-type dipeptide/oligopeptide/nickel transport system permease subunit